MFDQRKREEESYQDDQPYDYSPFSGVAPPISRDALDAYEIGIIKQIKPDDVLHRVEMKLKGYVWKEEVKEWVKEREAVMNDKGISFVMLTLSSVSELVTLSNYKPEDVPPRVLYVCDKIIPAIHINYKEYGVVEKTDLEFIDVVIFNFCEAALNKAIGAGDRNVIRGTVSESRDLKQSPYGMPPERRKSRLNPFARD